MALHRDHISLPGSTVDLESTGLNASLAPEFSGELQPGDVICGIADVSVASNWRDGVDNETCQDAQWINTDEAFRSISARVPAGDTTVSTLMNHLGSHPLCCLVVLHNGDRADSHILRFHPFFTRGQLVQLDHGRCDGQHHICLQRRR